MGSDSIIARANGQTIDETWFNILRSVLGVDFLPRNSAGVITSSTGSLGSDTYRWLNAYFAAGGILKIGTAEIYLSGNKVMIKDQGGSGLSLSEINTNAQSLITLSGVAEDAVNLGTFTGSIITDDQTIKTSLQQIETFIENTHTTFKNDTEFNWGDMDFTYGTGWELDDSFTFIVNTAGYVRIDAYYEGSNTGSGTSMSIKIEIDGYGALSTKTITGGAGYEALIYTTSVDGWVYLTAGTYTFEFWARDTGTIGSQTNKTKNRRASIIPATKHKT